MNKSQKLQFQKGIENYLEEKQVYNLFEDLLNQLIVQKPKNPLDFLVNQLQQPIQKLIFLVGPPGSNVRELSLQLADYCKFTCMSVGDLLIKEINKKSEEGEQLQKYKNDVVYAPDDLVNKIVIKHLTEKLRDQKKSIILEGFPKTKVQGLALQKLGFIPNSFILVNLEGDKLNYATGRKLKKESWFVELPKDQQDRHQRSLTNEYLMNMRGVRDIYKDFYYEIDGSMKKPLLLRQLFRMMQFRIKNKAPQRSSRIILVGPPATTRSAISRNLCRQFGFVHVSTRELVADQIAKKTEVGRALLESLNSGQLATDDIIQGLVHHRINKTDCLVQGFVLDGFPKNQNQVDMIEKLKIKPSAVIILEANDDHITKKLKSRLIDPVNGNIYEAKGQDAETDVIFKRLLPLTNSHPKKIEHRLRRWHDLLETVEGTLSSKILRIDATQPSDRVLESIAAALQNKG